MSNKIFSIIIGILFIIGGIFFFFKDIITISFTAVCFIIIGLTFNAYYFFKHQNWALLPGIYLLYLGIARAFFADLDIFNYIITAVFFLAPGSICFLLYFRLPKNAVLRTVGLVLLSIGICVLLTSIYDFPNINMLLLCLGLAFIADYIISLDYKHTATLIIGILLTLLAFREILCAIGFADAIISLLLVMFGFIIIIKALLGKGA